MESLTRYSDGKYTMKTYDDKYLASLQQVFLGNPDDLSFKKFFALELYKRKEYQDAYPLLVELYKEDKDINIEKALNDIKSKIPSGEKVIGFDQKKLNEILNIS